MVILTSKHIGSVFGRYADRISGHDVFACCGTPQLAVDDHILNVLSLDHQIMNILGLLDLLGHLVQGPPHTLSRKTNESCVLETIEVHISFRTCCHIKFIIAWLSARLVRSLVIIVRFIQMFRLMLPIIYTHVVTVLVSG